MNPRIVYLEVNDSGAWRRVTSFDLDWLEDGDLEHCTDALLSLSANPKIKARIIVPGDTAPLLTWKKGDCWREWGEVAA
jgi:hypothetical protein